MSIDEKKGTIAIARLVRVQVEEVITLQAFFFRNPHTECNPALKEADTCMDSDMRGWVNHNSISRISIFT